MVSYLFAICLIISIILILYMSAKSYGNIDTYFWGIVLVIPIILLGYMMKARANSVDDAKLAFCFVYLDSTVLLIMVLFSMLKMLGVHIRGWVKALAYSVSFLHLLTIWACKDNDLYYASFNIEKTAMGTVTKMTDGPLKFTHYIFLIAVFLAAVFSLLICAIRKKDCSRRSITIYSAFLLASLIDYYVEMSFDVNFSFLPYLYIVGDIIIVFNYEIIHSHDIDSVILEQQGDYLKRGYVAFDKKRRLLGYNQNTEKYYPEIVNKRIDEIFENDAHFKEVFYDLIDSFDADHNAVGEFRNGPTIFRCSVSYFYMNKSGKPTGYLIEIEDITAEQGYLNLIREYGQSLEKDVNDKTEHIRYIQQRVVIGMATIIENRDMNTGGHVKRTSDVIKILVDEMRSQNIGDMDDEYADQIVRSAPMHDLGKISIDNSILNKPGKLTDEEYAIMKTHSAKSGEIVNAILSGVEEPKFVNTAYNLARFHHERWDGRGYPERLAEIEIPLEARIMAVADVYDALVSKRCYKEPMSFEQAANIMIEGMGSQFDPMMKPVFEACRPKLEEYYRVHNDT